MTLLVSIIAIIGMLACGRRIGDLETTLRAIAQIADRYSATVPFQTVALRAIKKLVNDVLGEVSE